MKRQFQSISIRLLEPPVLYLLPLLVVLLIGFLIWFLVPSPPKTMVISTGAENGLYYRFGQQLSKELAKEKITLEVLSSAGSTENLQRLGQKNNPLSKTVELSLLQGGLGEVSVHPQISALASVFDEQVWIFYRKAAFKDGLTKITQLKSKTLSIGVQGSGTRDLGLQLLKLNQLDVASDKPAIQLKEYTAAQSLKAMQAGELDAVMLVSAPQAPILLEYLRSPQLAIMDFEQADAYSVRLPFLKKVVVPRGVINLAEDLPRKDISILATPAALVVHEDIHPALITPLMRAMNASIQQMGLLQKEGEYPSAHGFNWPHNEDAKHYLKTGPSFLHRHLPFWSVVWVDRAIRIILPLLVILIPLINYLPMLILLSVEAKTSAVYKKLRTLELAVQANPETPWQDNLQQLQMNALAMKVPRKYAVKVYELRMYIEMVRDRLASMK
jgi:TRAP transporter TAXI family solute receptor